MQKDNLISVIVPIYNVEPYIHRCIDSILAQTYKQMQIILVDDGSPDRCGEICDEYSKKDSRIIVIHQENEGLSGARNTGLLFAKGDYIAFVDSDDWIHPQMYETLIGLSKKYDLDIVRSSVCETDNKEYKKYIQPPSDITNIVIEQSNIFNLYFNSFLCKIVCNAVYRKDIVLGITFPERCQFEDNYASGRYLYLAKRMMIIQDMHYYYRINPNGISKSNNKRLLDLCICTQKLKHDLLKEGLTSDKFIKKLDYKLARELYHYIRAKDERWKVIALQKELKEFIVKNLDWWRKFKFLLLLYRFHIKVK